LKQSSSSNLAEYCFFQLHKEASMIRRFFVAVAFAAAYCHGLAGKTNSFRGGAGVGRLVLDELAGKENAWNCNYDMVLVERIQGKPKAKSGLFIPDEDLPRLHLCRVLSMGPGREEENGLIVPMPDCQVGSIVVAKNPWGIGPKDEELADGRRLSFMRSQDIAAVVTGGLAPEEE
jgi:co-chaperonin GroES (HSP10)